MRHLTGAEYLRRSKAGDDLRDAYTVDFRDLSPDDYEELVLTMTRVRLRFNGTPPAVVDDDTDWLDDLDASVAPAMGLPTVGDGPTEPTT